MSDIVLMRFPVRGVTYCATDGTPYRTDAQGVAGVAPAHVGQAEAAGATRLSPLPDPAPEPATASTAEDVPAARPRRRRAS